MVSVMYGCTLSIFCPARFDQVFSVPCTLPACMALEGLGVGQLLGGGAEHGELRFQHRRRLDTGRPGPGIVRPVQLASGGKLLHAVVPVGQAIDTVLGHGAQQFAALVALLETLQASRSSNRKRQVEHLELLGTGPELGQ